jgi:preprotein translocase subunit Sec63
MSPPRDTPAHRVIALAGFVLSVTGLIGIIVYPRASVVWFFLIVFGLAALPRAVGEWWRERRRL